MKVKKEYTPLSQETYDKWKTLTYNNGGSEGIVVPNGALSYTSLNNLKRDTNGWIEHYLRGNKRDISHLPGIKDGREFAEKMETDATYQELYPTLELKEKALIVAIPCQRMQAMVPLLIKMDAVSDDYTHIIDHKSYSSNSKTTWNQKKVFGHLQFALYSMAIWVKTGKIPVIECVAVMIHDGKDTGVHESYKVQYPEYVMEATLLQFEMLANKAVSLVQKEAIKHGVII
jgi:hypothetical protein